jgi:hypothetical protein
VRHGGGDGEGDVMRSGNERDRALVTWLFQMDGLNRLEKKAKAAGLDLNELMNAERSMVGGVVRLNEALAIVL